MKEELTTITGFISGYLSLCGVAKLGTYYSYFGVDIFQYIELSEVAVFVVQFIIVAIAGSLILLLIFFFLTPPKKFKVSKILVEEIHNQPLFIKRLWFYIKANFITVFLPFILIQVIGIIDNTLNQKVRMYAWIYITIVWSALFPLIVLRDEFERKYRKLNKKTLNNLYSRAALLHK